MNELVKWFQLKYPNLCKAMQECSHHYSNSELNPYHLEGDIFCHTMMVVNEAKNARLNFLNVLVCLLHDIGKPSCRRVNYKKERVHFFGHESVSAFMSLDILQDYRLSEQEVIHAFQLIALHTEPFKLDERQIYGRFVNNEILLEDLLKVSKCDKEGRFYEGENDEIYPRTYTKELGEFEKEVTMLIGLPCSGKSTWCTSQSDYILSRDTIVETLGKGDTYKERWDTADQKEVDKQFQSDLKDLIKNRENFIVDKTNMSRKSRRSILNQVPSCYKKKAVVFLTGLGEIEKRNLAREGKTIPSTVIENMIKSFYPPLYDEFDEIEWRVSK